MQSALAAPEPDPAPEPESEPDAVLDFAAVVSDPPPSAASLSLRPPLSPHAASVTAHTAAAAISLHRAMPPPFVRSQNTALVESCMSVNNTGSWRRRRRV